MPGELAIELATHMHAQMTFAWFDFEDAVIMRMSCACGRARIEAAAGRIRKRPEAATRTRTAGIKMHMKAE